MNDNRDYNKLIYEYNRMKANLESINTEYEQRKEQWDKKEAYIKNVNDHIRSLCEEILAKDKSEMVLGDNYNWASLEIVNMIDKAKYSYIKYNKDRTDLLKRVIDTAEDRGNQIQALQDEIIYLHEHQALGSMTEDELAEAVQREKEQKRFEDTTKDIKEEHGNIDFVSEEDDDVIIDESSNIRAVHEINESTKLNSGRNLNGRIGRSGVAYKQSDKKDQMHRDAERREIISQTYNINEIMNGLKDVDWNIICIMGDTGESERPVIMSLVKERENIADGKITTSISNLLGKGIITIKKLNLPLQPNLSVLDFTELGHKLYKVKYGKAPQISELIRIQKDHDNLEHGYGIKELAGVLREKGYEEVSTDRNKNIIKLSTRDGANNKNYIPDIISKYKGKTFYYEYERGNHKDDDFAVKLRKILLLTKTVNIITDKNESSEKIIKKVNYFINKDRNIRDFRNIVIRIDSLKNFKAKKGNCISNTSWQYIYDFNKGYDVILNNGISGVINDED